MAEHAGHSDAFLPISLNMVDMELHALTYFVT